MNSIYTKGMTSILVLTCLLLLSVPAAHAQSFPQVAITPTHTNVDPVGEAFSVEVLLNVSSANVTNLSGWQLKVGYNTTILNATNAGLAVGHPHEGKGFSFTKSIEDADGYILIMGEVHDLNDSVNVTVSKTLCHINFTSTAMGNSTLELMDLDVVGGTYMLNKTGGMIPMGIMDGDVMVIPEFSLLMTLAFMATVTAALVLLKKRWGNLPTQ